MKKAYDFDDLMGDFDNRTLHRMATLYKSVDDIDLFTAGISEYPVEGSMMGPVFNCLMAEQFVIARNSDRFWYENDDPLSKFSLEQLSELRKATLARLICDNSDDIDTVQLYPFLQPDQMVYVLLICSTFQINYYFKLFFIQKLVPFIPFFFSAIHESIVIN